MVTKNTKLRELSSSKEAPYPNLFAIQWYCDKRVKLWFSFEKPLSYQLNTSFIIRPLSHVLHVKQFLVLNFLHNFFLKNPSKSISLPIFSILRLFPNTYLSNIFLIGSLSPRCFAKAGLFNVSKNVNPIPKYIQI